jgi:glucose/arabinose dehydrogenase
MAVKMFLASICIVMLLYLSLSYPFNRGFVLGRAKVSPEGPSLSDANLKAELVTQGLKAPTSMVFLDSNDILITEKNTGVVERIDNKTSEKTVLLQLNVSKADERGLLGIALSSQGKVTNPFDPVYIFLYYTKPASQGIAEKNTVARYQLINKNLTNSKILLELPALPGPEHNGGKLALGPDNYLYITIGDVGGSFFETDTETKSQNYVNGSEPDGRAGILRITQEGRPVGNGIIGSSLPTSLYYAYGIKNIFGLDFDPITKNLWDTENGPTFGDEINLVAPGFNSGWAKVQGIWYVKTQVGQDKEPGKGEIAPDNPSGLSDFEGKGEYSPPEFSWDHSVAPTALRFFDSPNLGPNFQNAMFVGDAKDGNLYQFHLDKNRTALFLNGSLSDKVADNPDETQNIIFGKGFGVITDLQIGKDGNLYVLVYNKDDGRIYRIVRS